MLRYIVMHDQPFEGMWPPCDDGFEDAHPLPSFESREAALEFAVKAGMRSPKGRRDEATILAVEVPS